MLIRKVMEKERTVWTGGGRAGRVTRTADSVAQVSHESLLELIPSLPLVTQIRFVLIIDAVPVTEIVPRLFPEFGCWIMDRPGDHKFEHPLGPDALHT